MKKILEAEEFWLDSYFGDSISQEDKKLWMECNRQSQESVKIMIEFARLHVEEALKEASKKLNYNRDFCNVQKDILNSYPLENIR